MLITAIIPILIATADPQISEIIVKFQDSSGYMEIAFPYEKATENIKDISDELSRAENLTLNNSKTSGDSDQIQYGWGACGCEAPSDSMLINYKNGKSEKYKIYCGSIKRIQDTNSKHLLVTKLTKNILLNKWEATRYQFCPKGYGCSDANPNQWSTYTEIFENGQWEEDFLSGQTLELDFENIVKRKKLKDHLITIEISVEVNNNIVKNVAIDKIDNKYISIGAIFKKVSKGKEFQWAKSKIFKFRITCFNYFKEENRKLKKYSP